MGNERDGVVVFVKETTRELAHRAKMRGNKVVYDPLDNLCFEGRPTTFADYVDVVIIHNLACQDFYRSIFKKASFALIPHQWDYRLTAQCKQDSFKAGYIGNKMNAPDWWAGESFTAAVDMLQAAPKFNLHIGLNRRGREVLLKPATKVVTASAVTANVLTYQDPSAIELLGADYPYLVKDDPREMLKYAEETFGGEVWRKGLTIMCRVRERTSLAKIAALYLNL